MSATLNKTELAKQAKDGFDVLADLYRYAELGDYNAIEKDDLEVRFKWFGVYRQKPNVGHFMMRIKVPGGQLTRSMAVALVTSPPARPSSSTG
jgi:ferredoxin-nitrite reductase